MDLTFSRPPARHTRGIPISQLPHQAQRRPPGERSRPRHARSGFFFANDALPARRRRRSTARAPVNRVRREPYVRVAFRMMPTHSGGFDGTDVFNHPQNHPNGHPRRHAHRIGASVAPFYSAARARFGGFLGLTKLSVCHNQSKIGISSHNLTVNIWTVHAIYRSSAFFRPLVQINIKIGNLGP